MTFQSQVPSDGSGWSSPDRNATSPLEDGAVDIKDISMPAVV